MIGLGRYVDQSKPMSSHDVNVGKRLWLYPLLNNVGGDKIYDISGNNNHGTLTNGPVWTPTPYGMGLSFDGTDDYAPVASSGTGPFAAGCWVWLTAAGNYTYFLGLNDASGFFGLRSPSGTIVSLCDNAQDISYDPGAGWHRVVGVLDGTNGTLFVDGVQRAQATSAATGWDGFALGAVRDGGGSNQACVITDAFITNRAWSGADAALDYAQSIRGNPDTLNYYSPWEVNTQGVVSGIVGEVFRSNIFGGAAIR